MLKRGFKTDLNLKRFPKFSNPISGSSSVDNESKIQNHCFIFWFSRDLNSGTYALGNSILSFTEFLSMFECKDSRKSSALLISFIPFKNFAVAWMNVARGFFRHVVGLPTLYTNVICIWIYYGRYLTEVHITELAIIISKCNNCKCEWHNCFNYLRWVSARSFSVTNSPIA